LPPRGLGTAFVESLTSYTRRLAAEHSQPTAALIDELIRQPYRSATGCNFPPSTQITEALNGLVTATPVLIEYLHALTWVDSIERTALGRRTPGIYLSRSARINRTWCPECLGEDVVPYDRLLWSLAAYQSCVVHDRVLVDRCVSCHKTHRPLRAKTGANTCPHCAAALSATPSRQRAAGMSERLLVDLVMRLERGEQVTAAQVHAGVAAFVQVSDSKIYVAAAKIGRTHASLANILRLHSPMGLENLLLTIEASGETLDEFLDHPQQLWTVKPGHRNGGRQRPFKLDHIEPILRQVLAGPDATLPTATAFAATNGISYEMLRKHFSALCDELVERGYAERHRRRLAYQDQQVVEVKAAMRAVYAETGGFSQYAIAKKLGKTGILRSPKVLETLTTYKDELLAMGKEVAA
jgi:TniQ protein